MYITQYVNFAKPSIFAKNRHIHLRRDVPQFRYDRYLSKDNERIFASASHFKGMYHLIDSYLTENFFTVQFPPKMRYQFGNFFWKLDDPKINVDNVGVG